MNYTANVLLKPRRLTRISLTEFCSLLKAIKRPELFRSKISRIIPNSGCFLAGCCFSRQSNDDSLISSANKNYGKRYANSIDDAEISGLLKNHYAYVPDSAADMKRMRESTSITAFENARGENDAVSESHAKSAKAFTNEEYSNELETVQQRQYVPINNTDLPLKNEVNIFAQDADCENIISEPPLKRTKRNAKDDECIQEEISIKPEIVTVTDSPSTSTTGKKKEKAKAKKQRPNYFVAIQISDDQIHKNIKEVQNHIVQQDQQLKRIMTDIKTLHITLMVMFIGDNETHARAKEALWNVHQDIDGEMCKNPLQLEFKGLGHFQNRVLYAKLSKDETYPQLCFIVETVKKHFAAVSIEATDSKEAFTPHLTIAKIHFKDKNKGIKKINPSLYSAFNDQYFGTQNVESIQLLKMTGQKTEAGYYSGDICYFSSFEPSKGVKSLSKSLSVEEKKKDVKELINKLTQENIK